ncbi:MAG TPA: PASTA domain-containing protein [Candidatus Sulfotelmatobacter sp.]|nr:PASTA domain-containing protein [Candidatus Sulfotelmatobacter sp.]
MALDADAPVVRRRRRPWLLDRDWTFALALAFAVGVAVWFGRAVKDFFVPTQQAVLVPAMVGQTQGDAVGECTQLGLQCTVLATQPSEKYPKDVVMSQAPVAGTHVRAGRAVSLVVSSGVVIVPMPDLRFESLRTASLELNRLRLQLAKTSMVSNDDIPTNHVVTQDPMPLSSVRQGTRVTLTLSKGPPSDVRVPAFTGHTIDEARDIANNARIHLGQVVWTPFGPGGPPRGIVVRQKPDADQSIDSFDTVSLQVSAGPTVYGYLVRQVHLSVTVPPRDDAASVRVAVHDETGDWNVYDGYAQGGQKLDFNVTAVGDAQADTYIDNELLNQTTIGVEAPKTDASPSPKPRPPVHGR